MTSFVGVDLHRNNFAHCIRENGEEKKIGKCEVFDLKCFDSQCEMDMAMAVEATREFMRNAFRDNFLQVNGTAPSKVLPPVSRFTPTGDRARNAKPFWKNCPLTSNGSGRSSVRELLLKIVSAQRVS